MRRLLPILLSLLLLLSSPALAEGAELLVNGSVDEVSAAGYPTGWVQDMWFTEAGVSLLSVEGGGVEGSCLRVENVSVNDARWAQVVEVEPNTLYRFSAMVRAEGIGASGYGANLSIGGINVYSQMVYDTGGEWVELSLTGRTGPEQTQMAVFARIGGYGDDNLNTGVAWFDDLSLVEVSDAEAGDAVYNFYVETTDSGWGETEASEEAPPRYTETLLLAMFGYSLVVIAFARKARSPRVAEKKRRMWALGGILLAAFVVRLIVAAKIRGYHTDIDCFESWSERMASVGPLNFYAEDYFCDYPPVYMLLLAPVAILRGLFGIAFDSSAHIVLLKLLPIFCDLLGAMVVYRFGEKRLGHRAALLLSAFYAFNPAVLVDSAAWGQIDSVLTLLLVVCALRMAEGGYISSLAAFALAVLVKPQALLFAPVGLAALIVRVASFYERKPRPSLEEQLRRAMAERGEDGGPLPQFESEAEARRYMRRLVRRSNFSPRNWGKWLKALPANIVAGARRAWNMRRFRSNVFRALLGVAVALVILWGVSLPFSYRNITGLGSFFAAPIEWLWAKLFGATQGYRYMTVNTFNLYIIFGQNWKQVEEAGIWLYVAWAMFALSYLYAIFLQLLSRDRRKVFLTGAVLIVLVCTFAPMMHERYIYPAVILLLLAYADCRDRRLLWSALALTVTLFMNEALVLQGGMTELNYGHLDSSENWLNISLSVVNVINALFLAWTALDICRPAGRVYPLPRPRTRPAAEPEKSYKLGLRRLDVLLMAAVTAVYAVAAFVNLGDTKAPQTEWVSTAPGEEVIFDLGQERTFIFTYYGGICSTDFDISFSSDGETWTEPVTALYDQGQIFRWLWLNESGATTTARYARITVNPSTASPTSALAPLRLREVGFLDENGEPLPVVSVTSSLPDESATAVAEDGWLSAADGAVTSADAAPADPHLLIDEQDVVPAYPSYLNSTYFDEIYHARTAYEQLHYEEFDSAYEWTHPPLGKTLMMIGIELFGMTPFGWRFMGALMGVLMLPVMYLLVKQLAKRTDLSFIAMFLLAVDAMHFTQTRIATIDSYVVLFIMVMYLFMFRYSQMRWRRDGFARSLVPLGLSGLFMGIAWAAKWVGIYGSAGLVVIFFWTLWKNVRIEVRLTKAHRQTRRLRLTRRALRAGKRTQTAKAVNLVWRRNGRMQVLTLHSGVPVPRRATADARGAVCPAPRPLGIALFICLWAGMLLALISGAAAALDVSGLLALSTSFFGSALRLLARGWVAGLCVGAAVAAASLVLLCRVERSYLRRVGVLSAFCVVMFIIVPLCIYYFSYYWQLRVSGNFSVAQVVNLQKSIFDYHAGLGGDTHAFRSEWYQWPVIAWPMWYYSGSSYLPAGMVSSISCMGNPAVFWFGLVAILCVAVRCAWEKRASRAFLLVLIGFLSQYLPWVLVPRSTFIYHYFASVPFIIMASVLVLGRMRRRSRDGFIAAGVVLCVAALALFIAFYPLESGMPVSRAYASLLRWFNWINF